MIGPVGVRVYRDNNGENRASMEVIADDVEFLSPKDEPKTDPQTGYQQVETDELPFRR